MFPLNFKKCQRRMSVTYLCPCHMSNLRNSPDPYDHYAACWVTLRKGCVTLSILGVKGHTISCFCNTGPGHQNPALSHVRWEFPLVSGGNSHLTWLTKNSFCLSWQIKLVLESICDYSAGTAQVVRHNGAIALLASNTAARPALGFPRNPAGMKGRNLGTPLSGALPPGTSLLPSSVPLLLRLVRHLQIHAMATPSTTTAPTSPPMIP